MIHSQTVLFSPLFILLLLYSLGLPFPSSPVRNSSLHARVQKTATRRGEPVVLCVSDRLTLVVWRSSNCRFSVTYKERVRVEYKQFDSFDVCTVGIPLE